MENEVTNKDILDALNSLNENTVATNNSVKELQEYFIIKDRQEKQKEETAKKQEEQEAKKQEEITQQETKEAQSKEAEETAKADSETATYQEILAGIRDNTSLTNEIFAGQLFFTGVIAGLLVGLILWNRIWKQ